jgi:hypothetical protein
MTKSVFVCASIVALAVATAPGFAAEKIAGDTPVPRSVAPQPAPIEEDCETRIQKLDASNAEGQERLDEKHVVIDFCANQYKHDKTIERLVEQCAKYEEQPVVKQQFVAECQLAAFGYLAYAEGGTREVVRSAAPLV